MHKNCKGVIAAGTIGHIGAKFCQLAGSNSTTGTHVSTPDGGEWVRTKSVVCRVRPELQKIVDSSAHVRSKKGVPFTFDQCVALLSRDYRMLPDGDPQYLPFADFLQYRFICFTFILGALRSTQFIRFNAGGMRACHLEQQHYVDGVWRPLITALYSRAKVRNGPNPTAPDEVSELTIVCTCPGIPQPLGIAWKVDGTVKYMFGCTTCWFNLFTFIRHDQDLDCPDRFLRSWNKRAKGPGTVFWSADRITGAIQRWCSYSGLDLPAANNTWARKTYRTTIIINSSALHYGACGDAAPVRCGDGYHGAQERETNAS